jgi:hypothetical protein
VAIILILVHLSVRMITLVSALPQPLLVHAEANGNKTLTLSSEETHHPQLKEKIWQKDGDQIGTSGGLKKEADQKTKNLATVGAGSNPFLLEGAVEGLFRASTMRSK